MSTMDIDQALADLRRAYSDWEDTRGDGSLPTMTARGLTAAVDAADRMRDAAVAIDTWLTVGGYLPESWRTAWDASDAAGTELVGVQHPGEETP